MKISDILNTKGTDIVTIRPEATIKDLLKVLADYNIGALIVSADGQSMDGIVSERDVVRTIVDRDTLGEISVREIMTTDVHTCDPDTSLDTLRSEMTERRIRHVPVVAGGQLAGIVSIGDVVKSAIGQLEFERDQLNNYLSQ
ncbi:CBS domain-containing protein [Epidermidibacterium keratini]|uniref:CBS domain-containing protein n=1 Tax=Epidermidibacterium keratini TaxID=1891644 RepID=A0A7L4YSG2_9ACTN|nr:CBS domain-containing protein [Epidermidibacterium keratini]QHC02116.1 CBS domain-containing protein [Epidermidibacterium keratini]